MDKKSIILSEYDKIFIETLSDLGYRVFTFLKADGFNGFLKFHTDLFFLKINDTLFYSGNIKDDFLRYTGINTVKCKKITEGYPDETGLNCLFINNKLFCNVKTADSKILDFAKDNDIKIINIKQSYAKCVCCVAGENAVITEDEKTGKVLSENGVDVLFIKSKSVNLPGYDYGFIGGASFFDCDLSTVYFFGNIENHPQYNEIYMFCAKNNTKIVSLRKDIPLIDVGSAVVIG